MAIRSRFLLILPCIFSGISLATGTPAHILPQDQHSLEAIGVGNTAPVHANSNQSIFPSFLDALDVLQEGYFATWQGMWPTSIDWTSAVIGTYVSAALTSISTSFSNLESDKESENLINKYFSQLVGSYFGQDAFALRQEAYDDMLWVVLGWLESIKFINVHSSLHYESTPGQYWYGTQYIPAFAHRARLFWDLASKGWDTTLCDGGMIWSPYLIPYKNAITNELYIAASISMYLYFPGDQNSSPFVKASSVPPVEPHDPKYLTAAIEAYRWLNSSNMTNDNGLYTDGFHVSGWSQDPPANTTTKLKCDERNEMVYTYNQGVLLSGQRGLYEATGARSYLSEGHKLIEDVISATGWELAHDSCVDPPFNGTLAQWHGLGRSGVLEEACDAPGYCSQDGQTFKGIFFHHLSVFCSRLPEQLLLPGAIAGEDFEEEKIWHFDSCQRYGKWILHNANAALSTKNAKGKFGTWWGAPPNGSSALSQAEVDAAIPLNAIDYRNSGVPPQWKFKEHEKRTSVDDGTPMDYNDRGRGRTVETQGGGVSVLRAAWELAERGDLYA